MLTPDYFAAVWPRRANQWVRMPLNATTLLGAKREATKLAKLNEAEMVAVYSRHPFSKYFNLCSSRAYPCGKWEDDE